MLNNNQLIGFGNKSRSVAPPSAFTPSSISNLDLWFDATNGLSGTLLGDPISTWVAQVGGNATQTGTPRPTKTTLGGKVCASFDGVDDEMVLGTNPLTNTSFTIFALLYRASTMDKFCVFGNNTSNLPIGIYPYQSSGVFFGSSSKYGSGTDLTTGWNYYVGTWDGTNLAIRRNGAAVTLSPTSTSGASSWNRLGRRGSEITKGGLFSCGHYSKVLSASEITSLETYLAGL